MLTAATNLLPEARPSVRVMSRLLRDTRMSWSPRTSGPIWSSSAVPLSIRPAGSDSSHSARSNAPRAPFSCTTRAQNTRISIRARAVIERLSGGHNGQHIFDENDE